MQKVYLQHWEESERGWGVRPDGCSLHLDLIKHKSYVEDVYNQRDTDTIPHEYDRVVGEPIEVMISDVMFEELNKSGTVRLMQHSFTNLRNLKEIKTIFEDEPIV